MQEGASYTEKKKSYEIYVYIHSALSKTSQWMYSIATSVSASPDTGVCLPESRGACTGTPGRDTTHGPWSSHTPIPVTATTMAFKEKKITMSVIRLHT